MTPQEPLIVIDVKQTPGGIWANIGNGWKLDFRFNRYVRASARHARMCKGKHNLRRPR